MTCYAVALAAVLVVLGDAVAGTDVVFQRKMPDGTIELTNVPAGDNFQPVATVAATPGAVAGAAALSPAPITPAAAVLPSGPVPGSQAAQAAAFAQQLDASAPVRDGSVRQRMESLYEASRAAREARMQEVERERKR